MIFSDEIIKTISSNLLFSGLDRGEIIKITAMMDAQIKSYEKGDIIHMPWTPFRSFGIVLSGSVQVCCDDFDGNRMIMADVQKGITFGESLCFLKTDDSPVYITATEKCTVLFLSLKELYNKNDSDSEELKKRFTSLLASRTLSMNSRIQILSKISIRDKLMFYFSEMASNSGSNSFQVTMNREDMATYIGANRSALSRELSKMKKEGIIDFEKNKFTLLKKN